jgi:histidinol-phosphate aminotransferase
MSSVLDLARPDLRALRPYEPGAYVPGMIRLNANESPWRLPSDPTDRGLNVYPPPRPEALREVLARYYATAPEALLVTRGSSEAIDVLIRGFCQAGRDSILITPPTFDMYRVYATIQGAGIQRVDLDRDNAFAFDLDGVLARVDDSTKIVFVCTPNNPTGTIVPPATLVRLAEALANRALLVVDAAYQEYADDQGLVELRARFEHVVVLRTLSKFVALAGARCGALLADPAVVRYLENVLPPYTFPTPSIEIVLSAFEEESLAVARQRVRLIRSERRRLSEALSALPNVLAVYPSEANFVFVALRDKRPFVDRARRAGILVRAFSGDPSLIDCIRVTIGRPEDNDKLLKAMATPAVPGEDEARDSTGGADHV